jgi:hypothetical protein
MRQYAFLATAALFAVACSDDPTGPNNTITADMRADIAEASGEMVAADVESMARSEASSTTLFAFGGDLATDDCTGALGVYLCQNTVGDVDGEAQLTFRDSDGAGQDDYDETTTATTAIELDTDGAVSRSGFALSFTSERDFVLTGMAGAETSRTWAGTGTAAVTSSLHDGERDYQFDATTTYANVVVPASGSDPRWPTSGTATSAVDLEVIGGPDDGKTADVTVVVTFNGTANVPLRVGTTDYTLNLQSRTVTGPQ